MKPFTESMRYEYALTPDDLVIDLGAHVGTFALGIHQRYGCDIDAYEPVYKFFRELSDRTAHINKIFPYRLGVGVRDQDVEFGVSGDSSGVYATHENREIVSLLDISKILQYRPCDLLKLNIEGAEYEVLEAMLDRGLVTKCRNIQVQFHRNVPDCVARYEAIRDRLLTTHHFSYCEPFCWENYEINA